MALLSYFGLTLESAGYALVFFAALAESGLLVGFIFPGDTLLIVSGISAAQGYFDLRILLACSFAGAAVGDSIAYFLGKHFGPKIFSRENSRFFGISKIQKSREFYNLHGGKTIIFARFLPFVRTFAPIFAGIGRMPYGKFAAFNITGALLWGVGLTLAGYFLGESVPFLRHYVAAIAALVTASIAIPVFLRFWKRK